MCGINGFTWKNTELISKMNDALKHRGPDDEGIFSDENVTLGHVRLAIIDLSKKAHQPMKYKKDEKEVWIVYNGEIYNFMEIRSELENKGYVFNTHSDTEVILAAYLEWGYECVEKLNGMWAFAIYDKKKGTIFLSRDRFGIKPLYYHYDGENLVFSSEIKGILQHGLKRQINENKISDYLMFRGVVGEETLFKSIKKLLPGHNMVFDLTSRSIKVWRYWRLKPNPKYETMGFDEALITLDELLKKSVRRRLIADVKVGAILSGGLDSSVIAAYMRDLSNKVITFTVRFKGSTFDEGEYATKVAEYINAEHHDIALDFEDYIKGMEEYAKIKDEPIGVPNEVALFLLSKYIRKMGVYVVLSGEGSDEIFYGYNRIFRSPFDMERMRIFTNSRNSPEELRKKLPELYERYGGKVITTILDLLLLRYPYWPPEIVEKILKHKGDEEYIEIFNNILDEIAHDDYHKLSYFFLNAHLPILLNRVDNSTMANAVESRVPFLDHELVEFVFSLPNHFKSPWKSWEDYIKAQTKTSDEIAEKHDIPKYILKKLGSEKIPEEIINRRKMGFPIPFLEWKDKLIKYADELLNKNAKITKYVSYDEIKDILRKFKMEHDNYVIQRIWMLISLELWLRNWGE
ncbi:asparagine synthase, glutamine-hydrolyzing [Aciduliprofundum sp. MAR08-339]|uniref:asparagine synthase (glutamine-hydrolyzing) n=1 Tax=Aciduliprofundum sp. (strain MAR08-339) TaxID=673860 RepID=UPI0002A47DE1|nr:asparagine synthase, glutamine-hydrolyzing [Aciduliprofundum sp. MAR08-339]